MPFDPVCGKKVKKSELRYVYHGRTYYFCSKECLKKFEEKPSRYVIDSWDESSC